MGLIVGAGLLLLCFAGGFLALQRRFGVPVELVPVVCFSIVICVLYVGGILNFLPLAAWLLLAGGILCFAWEAFCALRAHTLKETLRAWLTPGVPFFVLASGAVAVYYMGAIPLQGDDFTHWAPMVKELLAFEQLPTEATTRLIYHPSYPPGSSLFVYFITRFLGLGLGRMVVAQGLLCVACATALFSMLRPGRSGAAGGRLVGGLVLAGAAVLCLSGTNGVYFSTLLVDTLLPLMGLAGTVAILRHADDAPRAALTAAPMLVAVMLIKNSGIFFVLVNVGLLLWQSAKQHKALKVGAAGRPAYKKLWGAVLAAVASPFVALFIWNKHVDLVFTEGSASRHAMRADWLLNVIRNRTPEQLSSIWNAFLRETFSVGNASLWAVLACNAVLVFFILAYRKSDGALAKNAVKSLVFADSIFIAYLLGTLAMYLFDMQFGSYDVLPEYTRYVASIMVYLYGLFAVYTLQFIQNPLPGLAKRVLSGAVVAVWLAGSVVGYQTWRQYRRVLQSQSQTLLTLNDQMVVLNSIGADMDGQDTPVFVYYSSLEDKNAFFVMARYVFFTNRIELANDGTDLSEYTDEDLENYRYLLIIEEDGNIRDFLQERFDIAGETPTEPVYDMYKLLGVEE